MKVVSWNCRGMGSNLKLEILIELLNMENPTIILFQETKLEETEMLERGAKIWKASNGKVVGTRGAFGGICTL